MDVKTIAQDLLVKMRGKKSQAYVNRRLGYQSNQVHRWESGARIPTWEQWSGPVKQDSP